MDRVGGNGHGAAAGGGGAEQVGREVARVRQRQVAGIEGQTDTSRHSRRPSVGSDVKRIGSKADGTATGKGSDVKRWGLTESQWRR